MQSEIDKVGMLDTLKHGLRLPPGWILGVVQIR